MNVQKVSGDPKDLLKMAESRAIILATEMAMTYGERDKRPAHEVDAKLKNVAATIKLILHKEKANSVLAADKISEKFAGDGLKVWMPELNKRLKGIGRGDESKRRHKLAAIYDLLELFSHL